MCTYVLYMKVQKVQLSFTANTKHRENHYFYCLLVQTLLLVQQKDRVTYVH